MNGHKLRASGIPLTEIVLTEIHQMPLATVIKFRSYTVQLAFPGIALRQQHFVDYFIAHSMSGLAVSKLVKSNI